MKTKIIKKITIALCFLMFTTTIVKGQEIDNSFYKTPQEMHDMFMKKHKSKTTAGWITLSTGIALLASGYAIGNNSADIGNGLGGAGLAIFGGVSALVSIPLFISAGSNKRKAELALKGETVSMGTFKKTNNISLLVTISF